MSKLNCLGYFMQDEFMATMQLLDHSGGCAHSFSQMTRVWIIGKIMTTEICSCGNTKGQEQLNMLITEWLWEVMVA